MPIPTIFAPGKLMLAGEYSVLAPGGQALAVAVEHGITISQEPSKSWKLIRREDDISWSPGKLTPPALRFAVAAWRATMDHLDTFIQPATLTYEAPAISRGKEKPGVGGSASATVATVATLLALAEAPSSPETILELALRAHRETQGQRGSGYDIATSTYGGLVHWRPGALLHEEAPPYQAKRLTWPEGLSALAGFSGESADTRALLKRLEEKPTAREGMTHLLQSTNALIDAFENEGLSTILRKVKESQRALASWDAEFQLGIITPKLKEMIHRAQLAGAVAKVSGAGGGDSILALCDEPASLSRLEKAWSEAGVKTFRVRPTQGVGPRQL